MSASPKMAPAAPPVWSAAAENIYRSTDQNNENNGLYNFCAHVDDVAVQRGYHGHIDQQQRYDIGDNAENAEQHRLKCCPDVAPWNNSDKKEKQCGRKQQNGIHLPRLAAASGSCRIFRRFCSGILSLCIAPRICGEQFSYVSNFLCPYVLMLSVILK